MSDTNVAPVQIVDPDPRKTLSDDDMLSLLIARYEASMDTIRSLRRQWLQWERLFRNLLPEPDWPFDTNLHIPAIFSNVMSFLPRLVSQRPRPKIGARNDDDIPTANAQREMIEYQWDAIGMNTKMIEFVTSGLVNGTAIGYFSWRRDIRERTFRRRMEVPTGGLGGLVGRTQTMSVETTEEVRVYDDPDFELIALEDFGFDPAAKNMDEARYGFRRIWMTWDEIDQWAESTPDWPWDKAAIRKLKDMSLMQRSDEDNELIRREIAGTFEGGDPIPRENRAQVYRFEVMEYYEPDGRMAVFTRMPDVLLLQQRNPFWHGKLPFLRFADNLLPRSFYGMGEAELIESMNAELDAVHNLRLEAAKRKIMQMFKVKKGSPPATQDVKFVPQGKILVDEMDDIAPLFDQDVPVSSYREEDMLRLWIQEASGATDVFKGLSTPIGNETATGASLMAQSSNSRASIKFQQLVEMTLRPMIEMWIGLNEQFIDEERWISVVGPEGAERKRIAPEDIARRGSGELDVRIDVGATDPVNKVLEEQNTLRAIQTIGTIPPEAMATPQMQTLMNRYFDLLELPAVQAVPAPVAPSAGAGGGISLAQQTGEGLSPAVDNAPAPNAEREV